MHRYCPLGSSFQFNRYIYPGELTMGTAGGDADRALKKKKRKQTGTSPSAKNGHEPKDVDTKISNSGENGVEPRKGCVDV